MFAGFFGEDTKNFTRTTGAAYIKAIYSGSILESISNVWYVCLGEGSQVWVSLPAPRCIVAVYLMDAVQAMNCLLILLSCSSERFVMGYSEVFHQCFEAYNQQSTQKAHIKHQQQYGLRIAHKFEKTSNDFQDSFMKASNSVESQH